MRACERLMKAVRKVYGEESNLLKTMGDESGEKQQDNKKDKSGKGRKVSDQTSIQTSPIRRKDSVGKKDNKCKDFDHDLEKNEVIRNCEKKEMIPEKTKESLPILKYLKTQVKHDVQHERTIF